MHPFHTPQGLMQIVLGVVLALLLAPFVVSFVPAQNKG
jgi:hypothetical protein